MLYERKYYWPSLSQDNMCDTDVAGTKNEHKSLETLFPVAPWTAVTCSVSIDNMPYWTYWTLGKRV